MSLVFVDGFDYYRAIGGITTTGPFPRKWGNITANSSIVAGRHNAAFAQNLALYSGVSGNNLTPPLGDEATWIVGFALRGFDTNTQSRAIMYFFDVSTVQCALWLDGNQRLTLLNGISGATQATGTTPIRGLTWYHIQIKVTINNTTGSVHVKLNGQDEIHTGGGPVTSLDTQVSANATANKIALVAHQEWYFDDLWICNTTTNTPGPPNDDFLGDIKVETLFANGVGNSSQWTPLAGSNYENVDETATDDDTSYVFSSTPTNVDTYTFANLAQIDAGIKGVAVNLQHRKTTAGSKTIRPIVRHSGTDYAGTTVPVFDDYASNTQIYQANPGTSATWTTGDVDAAEFGAELVS